MKQLFTYTLLIALAFSFAANAQQNVQLTIVDGSEKTPLIGAHVCLISEAGEQSYYATDMEGQVSIPFAEKTKCTISYTGFVTKEFEIVDAVNQQVKLKPDLMMLDQVVKTATVEAQKVDESIYSIEVINSSTMEKQGVQNVRDALRFQSNINLQEDGVLGSQIVMQGMKGQHVKILVDGIPIIGRQDGNIDLSQIDMSQVDHVEIIEGPMSVVYGSNALAGTINIITKENKYYSITGSAMTYAESVGQFNGNASVSGNIGKHKYGASGSYRYFDGHDLNKSNRAMNWNPKNQVNMDVYYGLKLKEWDTKIGVRYNNEDLTYKGNFISATSAFDTEFATERITYYGQSTGKFKNNSALNAMISLSTYDRTSQVYFVNVAEGTSAESGDPSTDKFDTWNARLSYANSLTDKLKWQLGYELTDESGEGEKVSTNKGLTENALWSDLQIEITDHLILQPGVRYLHHNVYNPPLIYSAHLKWQSDSKWEGRLSFARGFRAPSMKELYMDFVDTNHQIFGNPDLIPETSYNATGAMSKYLEITENSILKLDASVFYNHLYDVIELVQGTDGMAYYYQNISEKKTHGGTMSLNYNKDNRFKANVGFTLTGIGYNIKAASQFDFEYSKDVVAMVSYFLPKLDLSTQLDCKYTGERIQLFTANEEGEITQGVSGAYTMLNYSLTKSFKNKRYVLTGGVKNILDVTNVTNTTQGGAHSGASTLMIAWGRTYYASFKVNLKKI